jgi:hypothetical protein
MGTLTVNADERVGSVEFTDEFLTVGLEDGRRISVSMEWFPRLAHASREQLQNWQLCAAGYVIRWPGLDEYCGTESILCGAPAASWRFSRSVTH